MFKLVISAGIRKNATRQNTTIFLYTTDLTVKIAWEELKQSLKPNRLSEETITFHNDSNYTFKTEKRKERNIDIKYIFTVYANIVKMLKNDHHSDITGL